MSLAGLSSMSGFNVRAGLNTTGFSSGLAGMKAEMSSFAASSNATMAKAAGTQAALFDSAAYSGISAWERFASKTEAVGQRMVAVGSQGTKAMLPLIAVLAGGSVLSAQFNDKMSLIETQAGATGDEVRYASEAVLDMAGNMNTASPNDLADALFHVESAGYRGSDAMDILNTSAQGAMVGEANLEDATNTLVGVMKSNIGGVNDYGDAMGQVNAIIGTGNMRMSDLTAALSSGILPAAATFGLTLRDVGAALDTMTINDVPAEAAATRLRMTFSLLGAPTAAAQEVLQGIGLSATDLASTMRTGGIVPAIQMLRQHLDEAGAAAGLTGDDLKTFKAQTLSAAFGGGRSSSAILTLVNSVDTLDNAYQNIGANADSFNDKVLVASQDPMNQLKSSVAEFKAALIKLGDEVLPTVAQMVSFIGDRIKGLADFFDNLSPGVRKVAVIFMVLAATIFPVVYGLGKLITTSLKIVSTIKMVASGISTAFSLLAANPIVLLIIAIVAVIAIAAYMIYTHWDSIKEVFWNVVEHIKSVVIPIWDWIKEHIVNNAIAVYEHVRDAFFKVKDFIGEVFDKIKSVISTGVDVFNKIKDAVTTVIDFVREHWRWILPIIMGPLGLAIAFITGHWNDIKTVVMTAINFIVDKIKWFANIYISIWQFIFNIGMTIVNGIIGAISWLWNNIFVPFGNFLVSIFVAQWQILTGVLSWVWNAILVPFGNFVATVFVGAWNGLIGALTWLKDNILSPIGDTFNWIWNTILVPIGNFLEATAIGQWNAFGSALGTINDNVIQPLKSALETIWDLMTKIGDAIGSFGDKVGGFLGGVGDKLGGAASWLVGASAEGGGPYGPYKPFLTLVGEGSQREWIVTESQMQAMTKGNNNGQTAVAGVATINNKDNQLVQQGIKDSVDAVDTLGLMIVQKMQVYIAQATAVTLSGANEITQGIGSKIDESVTAAGRGAGDLMVRFGQGLESGSTYPIGIATNIVAAVRRLFGGSLPEDGPLAGGLSMFHGGISLMQMFGHGLLTGGNWLKAAVSGQMSRMNIGEYIPDVVKHIGVTYPDVFAEIERLSKLDEIKAIRGIGWSENQLGKPYIWGSGHPPDTNLPGYDCSGFVSSANKFMGIPDAGTTYDFAKGTPGEGPVTFGVTDDLSHMAIRLLSRWYESGEGGVHRSHDYFPLKFIPGGTGAAFGNWQDMILKALAIKGKPADWLGPMLSIMGVESSGNQFARNPSSGARGLWQIMTPMHMAEAQAFNPWFSTLWIIDYMTNRYGGAPGAWAYWQQYHSYAGQGLAKTKQVATLAEKKPEYVLHADIVDAFVRSTQNNNSNDTRPIIVRVDNMNITTNDVEDMSRQIGKKVVVKIKPDKGSV